MTVDGDEVALAVPLNVAFFNPDLLAADRRRSDAAGARRRVAVQQRREHRQRAAQQRCSRSPRPATPNAWTGRSPSASTASTTWVRSTSRAPATTASARTTSSVRRTACRRRRRSRPSPVSRPTSSRPASPSTARTSLDVTALFDIDGTPVDLNDADAVEATGTRDVRRSTVAARLRGVYGNVNNIDAFTGLIAEKHVPGTEFGELQLAMWTREFQKLRDGDRFFYGNDQGLSYIKQHLRHRLPPDPGADHHRQHRCRGGRAQPERLPGTGRQPAGDDVQGGLRRDHDVGGSLPGQHEDHEHRHHADQRLDDELRVRQRPERL